MNAYAKKKRPEAFKASGRSLYQNASSGRQVNSRFQQHRLRTEDYRSAPG